VETVLSTNCYLDI